MKFRIAKTNNVRRIAAANAKLNELKSIEKEVRTEEKYDAFWVLIWSFLGHFILGFNHRSLMECFVLQDKGSAKYILQKIFLKMATSIRTSSNWYGYQNYLHPAWMVRNYNCHDEGSTLVTLLERAVLSIKRDDDKALIEVLEALHILLQENDSHWWDAYCTQWGEEVGSSWASYSQEYLESPMKLESPQFEEISFYSEGMENWEYILPQDVYIDMKAFKRLLNGGLRLSEPVKIIGKKLP